MVERALSGQALVQAPSPTVSALTGFDPSRTEFAFEAPIGRRHLTSGFWCIVAGWPQADCLWWRCDERRWVSDAEITEARETGNGFSCSNSAPCRSFKAFKRHVRRHAQALGGREVRLISGWVDHDVTARLPTAIAQGDAA